MNYRALFLLLLGAITTSTAFAYQTQHFQFTYQNLTYTGEVMLPTEQPSRGTIVMIPGHGPTEFVDGEQFLKEREFLVAQQYSVAYWDKAGCGLSEGEYDHNQSIESSAKEALAALDSLATVGFPNHENLGYWSISRGGWIVPKITELDHRARFWISVSGTIALDNGRYMLEANLRAEQRDPAEIDILMSEWDSYQRILVRGGTLEEFTQSTPNLMVDPFFNNNDFRMTEEILTNIQSFFQSGAMTFDKETNLAVVYPDLESTLTQLKIPVLAILGRLDTQIDWRATGELYARAAKNGDFPLTTAYLDTCNHIMQESVTGALYEALPPETPVCAGYFESIEGWLDEVSSNARNSAPQTPAPTIKTEDRSDSK